VRKDKRYLSTDDVAYALDISRPTVIKYIREKKIQAVKTGKAFKIAPEALITFANQEGFAADPLKVLAMRDKNFKKTVPLTPPQSVENTAASSETNPQRLIENPDALYFLSIRTDNGGSELVMRVRESILVVGRCSMATLSVQDPYVSNIHATLTYNQGFITLRDQSTNGTQVGDTVLHHGMETQLGAGGRFRVGHSLLTIIASQKINAYLQNND